MASSDCDLQVSLVQFAVKSEVVWMIISVSKYEGMILSQKRVECPPQVRDEVLPQIKNPDSSYELANSPLVVNLH